MIDKLQNDLKQAQLKRDEVGVSTLRLLLAEIKNAEIAKGQPLDNAGVLSVIQKEVKKRKESAAGFRQGGREDRALKEEAESKVLESYLPAQISDEELTKIVDEAISNSGAKTVADMGRVIGAVMAKVESRADGARVSAMVLKKLS